MDLAMNTIGNLHDENRPGQIRELSGSEQQMTEDRTRNIDERKLS